MKASFLSIERITAEITSSVLSQIKSMTVGELLDARAPSPARKVASRQLKAVATPAPQAEPRKPKSLSAAKRPRRDKSDLGALSARIEELLAETPGLRAEQIRARLGVDAKTVTKPLRDAVKAGRITTTGNKRSTAYNLVVANGADHGESLPAE
jgi:hypothetical protein